MAARSGVHQVTRRGRGIGDIGQAGVVHPQFLPADMYRELLSALADFLGGRFHTVRQYSSDAFPLDHLFRHGDDCLVVAPGKLDAVSIRFG